MANDYRIKGAIELVKRLYEEIIVSIQNKAYTLNREILLSKAEGVFEETSLSERERRIIDYTFGLTTEPLKRSQIAEKEHITIPMVQRIKTKALRKIINSKKVIPKKALDFLLE
ncbi:MAG: sigma factor-like helix-turn-helix DNA-binding protein [Nanoarchaeota archaeon]